MSLATSRLLAVDEVDAQVLDNPALRLLGEQMEAIGQAQLGACTARIVGVLTGLITGVSAIDRLLDDLLNAARTADGTEVFRQVCRFLYPNNPRLVAEYVYAYRDLWDDEAQSDNPIQEGDACLNGGIDEISQAESC